MLKFAWVPLLGALAACSGADHDEVDGTEGSALAAVDGRAPIRNLTSRIWARRRCERWTGSGFGPGRCADSLDKVSFSYPVADNQADDSGNALMLLSIDDRSDQPGSRYYCDVHWQSVSAGDLRCSTFHDQSNEERTVLAFVFVVTSNSLVLVRQGTRSTYTF